MVNLESPDPEAETVAFVDGDFEVGPHAHIELPSMTAGEYLVICKGTWYPKNTLRKLIFNIYAPDPVQIKRIQASTQIYPLFCRMDAWL